MSVVGPVRKRQPARLEAVAGFEKGRSGEQQGRKDGVLDRPPSVVDRCGQSAVLGTSPAPNSDRCCSGRAVPSLSSTEFLRTQLDARVQGALGAGRSAAVLPATGLLVRQLPIPPGGWRARGAMVDGQQATGRTNAADTIGRLDSAAHSRWSPPPLGPPWKVRFGFDLVRSRSRVWVGGADAMLSRWSPIEG